MRKGLFSVDWVLGFGIFLIFAALMLAYYANVTTADRSQPLEDSSTLFADRIVEYLQVSVYDVPVRYTSSGPVSNAVLYLEFSWPFGKNTTQLFKGSSPQTCNITGNTLYWRSDLSSGVNNFTMRFTTLDQDLQCDASLTVAGANQTIPGAVQKGKMVSQTRLDNMTNTSYGYFKESLGIDRDFRIELDINGTESSYGPETPLADVYVRERWGTILETNQDISIRILLW